MGVLDFIPRFKKNQKNVDSNYLSLVITPDEVSALIWAFREDMPQVLGFGKKKFENIDSLIHQAAVAIDKAGEAAKSDVEKAVFGVSHYWLEDSKPKSQTNKLLKDMEEDLDLTSQAFIPIASAINHLLKIKEGQLPKAVLVGIFGNFLEVHLLTENKVTKSLTSQSPANIEKINQLIGNLKEEGSTLPPRVVFYGDDSPSLFEKFHKSIPAGLFETNPRTSYLDERDIAVAVSYAQAADILGREPHVSKVVPPVIQTEPEEAIKKGQESDFLEGEDVLMKKPDIEEKVEPTEELAVELPPESNVKVPEPIETAVSVEEEPAPRRKKSSPFLFLTQLFKVPKINFPLSPKRLGFAIAGIVVLLLIAGFASSIFLTSAEVTIKVNAKNQEEGFKTQVVLGSGSENQVSGSEQKAVAAGSQKKVTTGSKKLGNKAKGTVKVLNWDKSQKTFGGQTELITKDGLKFTLDGEVQIASRSATTPGESKVAATAADVGEKHNIASGVDMTIVGFDEIFYSGVSDTAFSGGDERQSTVVSQADLDSLLKTQTDTLTQKAKEDLKNNSPGQKILDEAIVVKVLKKEFDKKLDEEASLVNLDMEIEASTIVYSEDELKNVLARNLDDVPDNLEALGQNIEIIDLDVTRTKSGLSLSGKLNAGLVPKFNEDEIKEKIKGKSTKDARISIKEFSEVTDVLFKFNPNIPFFDSLPKNKEKIKIVIEAS